MGQLVGTAHKGSLLTSDGHSRQPTLLMLTLLRYLTDALAEPVNQFDGCSTNCAQPHTGSLLTSDGHSRQTTLWVLTLRYLTDALAEPVNKFDGCSNNCAQPAPAR